MRGGQRSGGRGSVRDHRTSSIAVADAPKFKDRRSGGRRSPPYARRPLDNSPPLHSRPRRSPGRRSSSAEPRDYSSRRLDQRKQPQPQPQPHTRPAHMAVDDEEFPYRYMLPDHRPADPIAGMKPDMKSSQAVKDLDFNHHGGGGTLLFASSGPAGRGVLAQNSAFLDDRSEPGPYFRLPPPDTAYHSEAARTGGDTGNLNSGIHGGEMLRYHDKLRDPYDERDREKVYTRNVSFPTVPSFQPRSYAGASSSGLVKDDFLDSYGDRLHHPLDGYGAGGGASKFTKDSLEPEGHSQAQFSDPTRSRPLMSPARDGPQDYSYQLGQSDRVGHGYPETDDTYRNISRGQRGDYLGTISSSFTDLAGGTVNATEASGKNLSRSNLWGEYRSSRDEPSLDYHDVKMVHEDYMGGSGSGHAEYRMKLSYADDLVPYKERYDLGKDSLSTVYRERETSPRPSDRHVSMYKQSVSPRRGTLNMDDLDLYNMQRGRMTRRTHSIDDDFGKDSLSTVYRERETSPRSSDRHVSMYKQSVSPRRGTSNMDDLDLYNMQRGRMTRRTHSINDAGTEIVSRRMLSKDHNAYRRVHSPEIDEEIWEYEDRVEFPLSKRLNFGRPLRRKPAASRISRPDSWLQSGDSTFGQGGRGMSLKKRLRLGPSEFHGSFPAERRHDFRPHKYGNKGFEDHQGKGGFSANQGDALHEDAPLPKTDPPEDSEEFKHQVHKAFLRFSKLLNETSDHKTRYLDQRKAGNLLCCVCGSHSKGFVDIHSLATHAYNSLKVGLRTEHLGFHKALCLLMGWNWLVAPDTRKNYQLKPASEIMAMKEDLILWPPIVIIHDVSIGNNSDNNAAKVVSIERMEELLREMGFGAGKTRVGRGKPGKGSVFAVKFMPTFSGLQEAERLHRHYADNNRGRSEFQQMTTDRSGGNEAEEGRNEKVEELLYGYIAIAEDLDKLDPETKKRCLVKSRKDIEAIADAPLNTD